MAKKKHHKKTTHHRPRVRRMGATHGGDFMGDAEMLIGLVGGSVLATAAQRQLTSFNPKIVSGLEIFGGLILRNKFPGQLMQGVGYGIAGAGAIGVAHEFGVIKGIDNVLNNLSNSFPSMAPGAQPMQINPANPMSGISNDAMLSGINNDAMLSGISNNAMMSGGEDAGVNYHKEYEGVMSLGM